MRCLWRLARRAMSLTGLSVQLFQRPHICHVLSHEAAAAHLVSFSRRIMASGTPACCAVISVGVRNGSCSNRSIAQSVVTAIGFQVRWRERNFPRYGWQRIGDEEEDLEVWAAWVSLVESRAPEVEKFLGECWETVEQRPNTPFRAAFR